MTAGTTTLLAKNKINKAPKKVNVKKATPSGDFLTCNGEPFDIDLGFTDSIKNKDKFYKLQIIVSESKYHLVQNWGRTGKIGQTLVKEFENQDDAIKQFKCKFLKKSGVKWEERAQACSNARGKYRTLTEQRVAAAGGRIADNSSVCFCLSWNDRVDLDIHCVMPNGESCYFSNKNPANYISLDVDK
jgi:predicted DNA-binding WGR domain protein